MGESVFGGVAALNHRLMSVTLQGRTSTVLFSVSHRRLEIFMPTFSLYSVLILGLASAALAEGEAVSAVQAEAKVEVTLEAATGAAEASATAEAESKSEATPEAPAKLEAKPAENKEDSQKQAKAEALKKAAEEDPDVAARLETPYPLDGEEWREYPLGILEFEMQEAIEDLAAGKSKPPALVTQPRIISRLDFMIEELEKKTGGGTGSSNAGNKPAEKSALRKGQMKEGQMRAAKNEGDRWADIPAKEREKILQSQGEGFPAGYEDVLADYFRKLSKSEKPTAAPPVPPQGSK